MLHAGSVSAAVSKLFLLDDGQPFHNPGKVRVADHPSGTRSVVLQNAVSGPLPPTSTLPDGDQSERPRIFPRSSGCLRDGVAAAPA